MPASQVGLEGRTVKGWAYTLYDSSIYTDASEMGSPYFVTGYVQNSSAAGGLALRDAPSRNQSKIFVGQGKQLASPGSEDVIAYPALSSL